MWAPLATGIAVAMSRSMTQLADLVRRSTELLALLVSWLVFRHLDRNRDIEQASRERLERVAGWCVAAALCASGVVMLVLALTRGESYVPGGNVYPGLAIAAMGLVTNAWFWHRYSVLTREHHDPVIASQRPLYRAKTLVDLCVLTALATVAIAPGRPVTRVVDAAGSLAVGVYLLVTGIRMALSQRGGAARAEQRAGDACGVPTESAGAGQPLRVPADEGLKAEVTGK